VDEVKELHDLSYKLLIAWLEEPPTDRRQRQALDLLAEANQKLYAACINVGAIKINPNNGKHTSF